MKLSHMILSGALAACAAFAQAPASRPVKSFADLTPQQMVATYETAGDEDRETLFTALVKVARRVEPQLRHWLVHKDAKLRLAGLRILQQALIKAPAVELTALTRDADDRVRETAVIYLAACRPDGWTATLLRIARDDRKTSVRRQALVGLGESKDLALAPDLIGMLGFVNDEYLAKRTAAALQALTGVSKGVDQAAWQRWWAEKGVELHQAQERARAERAQSEVLSAPPR